MHTASRTPLSPDSAPLAAVIVGAGFGGIGMAIALKQAGVHDFVMLEKAQDVGGVWRDNSYPGAACDVPSHLYSFSFEPNADWSRMFATQAEIHDYLQRCVRKHELLPCIRFGAEVERAAYDEDASLWRVRLVDGTVLRASLFITATGQLSRPSLPRLPGMESFKGHSFHSARWDHGYALAGKRVAVVGTGASAIQFVPAIAGLVSQLTVFQRSPAYMIARPDRAYAGWEKALFRAMPWAMKLYRATIYLRYEVRALAFTRFKGLMQIAVGIPFRRMLSRQVPDAAMRNQLTPDYPIGCKRVLLSSEYLSTMTQPNVKLVTQGIRRVTEGGIETTDGAHHPADAIIYGTGFAATEFLSPMRITGRSGLDLNRAWQGGAKAYLGLTVPGFPNFFMLYGPNTNLGHNSIVFMLESQIAHVMRCLKAMRAAQATAIEVDAQRYRRYNAHVQQRLAHTVWNGCKSWYLDESGHNSNNWPGFTVTYRWHTRFLGLRDYRFTRSLPSPLVGVMVPEPTGWWERANAAFLRGFLRTCFRSVIGPPFGAVAQRRVVSALSLLMPGVGGVTRRRELINGVPTEVVSPRGHEKPAGVILYLHGGAFCLGGPTSHRSITTRLAVDSGLAVWVPDYRLSPEHPYPAALDDALRSYGALREQGYAPGQIVVAGDSAGGALALALGMSLRDRGEPVPASLLLISPVTDATLVGESMKTRIGHDPMIRLGWVQQGLAWYNCPAEARAHRPLEVDLKGLPPMLIQVGDQEILLSDATRLALHAAHCGVPCRLEVHGGRWHVFHLQSLYLHSARAAVGALAGFARETVAAPAQTLTLA